MATPILTQRTILNLDTADTDLITLAEAFLIDRKVQNLAAKSILFYRQKLELLMTFCATREITKLGQFTTHEMRRYLNWLQENGHNPGGIHAAYRAIRCFMKWVELEFEPDNWASPHYKVKAPRVNLEPLDPVTPDAIRALLGACKGDSFIDQRDKAIINCLLDTGARAKELLSINRGDIDFLSGSILIRTSKSRKPRTVFIGKETRKTLRRYLRLRQDDSPALFVTKNGERLAYGGLRAIITRRADIAGIDPPTLHGFRRAFALNMLRNGVDIFSLQLLMGHAGLDVLRRYLAQTTEDLRLAHMKGGPVDRL